MTGQPQDQTMTGQPQDRTHQAQQAPWNPFATLEQVGVLALGAVDLVLDQLRQAAAGGQGAARRSDLRELVADGMRDLKARGELASRRVAAADSDNYLELMARRAIERSGRTAGAAQPDQAVPPHA
ncbi:hypothetical protein [Streptomyces aureocirculatus]|uniref:hypothetical protein n=1 Tax=Streptomyces aureocirculatus TaxID=67275 RepID=UPI0012FED999|nr:hypothetical protein [Streptomyces aureocirculatus]